jgi:hypothetical protein
MIGFWARIVNGKKEKISRTLYDILYQLDLCDVYHSKLLNCVKDILNKCGLGGNIVKYFSKPNSDLYIL